MKTITEAIEDYILSGAECPRPKGSVPINVWMLTSDLRKGTTPFDDIYIDAEIQSLTRPLKIACGSYSGDWAGFMMRTYRQITPKMLAPSRPFGRPNVIRENYKGKPLKKPHFHKINGRTTGLKSPSYMVQSTLGGKVIDHHKRNRKKLSLLTFLLSEDGKEWRELHNSGLELTKEEWREFVDVSETGDRSARETIGAAIGLQCFTEYCWTVEFQFSAGASSILFPVKESVARRLVKMSDLTEGQKRKRILHFVQAHTRVSEDVFGDENEVNVMRHLRGEQLYLWQGCRMKVMPPVNDLYSFERDTKKIRSVRKLTEASL